MARKITTVGFDADDTLWHNERYFQMTQSYFAELLSDYTEADTLMSRLVAAEKRNLGHYGFGVKGFTLSMIETALDVTDRRVPGAVIEQILEAGREMLAHPVDLLPHAREAVESAARTHRILLITKGDLLDQERKLAQSGLGDLFDAVEIVSDKNPGVYRSIFDRHGHSAICGVMVGNSVKSDILPMIEAGGYGIHVPHDVTWELEHAETPCDHDRFRSLPDLGGLAKVLETLR
ncbi:HAD family hydrolase [uncultured Roseobacter sp.]|uniref:HAD family hydrolase n=1 Tax=uncultured Roseobacter sp. TaxID=114847 RepID=UPI0026375FD3|nr:HAD family hydrolase [uncultured Roseobacter sp.]